MNTGTLSETFAAQNPAGKQRLFDAIDRLMGRIDFDSTAESILPQSAARAQRAFTEFLKESGLHLSLWSLDVLMTEEKVGKYAFRKDDITPNWYHEFRQTLMFLSLIRSGTLPLEEVEDWGGVDGMITGLLRHDSLEDFGKTREEIVKNLQEQIDRLDVLEKPDPVYIQDLHHKCISAVKIVDRMSRKTSVLRADRKPLIKDGNFVRKDRFDGDLNRYFERLHGNPLAGLGKYFDSIEGMSTRVGVKSFDALKDLLYANERRYFFGVVATDRALIGRFPLFKEAVKSADFMLGITLVTMETINHFNMNPTARPDSAFPMDIERYMPRGLDAFRFIPPAFRPDCVMIERLRAVAEETAKQGDLRLKNILENAILPALTPYRGYYPKSLLPTDTLSGDMGPWPRHP
jgi:hypothetical protein